MPYYQHPTATNGSISLRARHRTQIHPDGSYEAPADEALDKRLQNAGHKRLADSHVPPVREQVPEAKRQAARRAEVLEAKRRKHQLVLARRSETREARLARAEVRNKARFGKDPEQRLKDQLASKVRSDAAAAAKSGHVDGKPIEKMTRPEAYNYAKGLGIEVEYSGSTKGSLLELIRAHQEGRAPETTPTPGEPEETLEDQAAAAKSGHDEEE